MRIIHEEFHREEEFRQKMSKRLTLGLYDKCLSLDELDELAYIWQEKLCEHIDNFPFFDIEPTGYRRDLNAPWQRDIYMIYGLFPDDHWWEMFETQDKSPLGIEEALSSWLAGVPAEDIVA